MSNTNNVVNTSGVSPSVAATASGGLVSKDAIGRDTFLKLLVTQMKYQDPMSPMENTAFTAQLAQFSSLDKLTAINDNLGSLQNEQSLSIKSGMPALLGNEVLAEGNSLDLAKSGGATINFSLSKDSELAVADIIDGSGRTVKKIIMNSLASGVNSVEWDGNDQNGNRLKPGGYTFYLDAVDSIGRPVGATSLVRGVVNGISYNEGNPYLLVDNAEVSLASVQKIFK